MASPTSRAPRHAPSLGGTGCEESEEHEAEGVQRERVGVALRGEAVDALEHEGGTAEVGEQRRVGQTRDQDGADKDAVGEQLPEDVHAVPEAAAVASARRQGLAHESHAEQEDQRAADGQEHERAAPVGDPCQLSTHDGADDRSQAAQHRESPVVPDQLRSGVQVAAGGLGDHDADGAGQALHESGDDERRDRGSDRTEQRGGDEGGHAEEEGPASAVPVGDGAGDELPDGEAEQAGGHGELGGRGAGTEFAGQRRQHRQVQVHRDGPEDREHGQHDTQQPVGRPSRCDGRTWLITRRWAYDDATGRSLVGSGGGGQGRGSFAVGVGRPGAVDSGQGRSRALMARRSSMAR